MLDKESAAAFGQIMYGLAYKGIMVRVGVEKALFGDSDFIKFTVSYYTPSKKSITYNRAFTGTDLMAVSDPAVIVDIIISELAKANDIQPETLMKWLSNGH